MQQAGGSWPPARWSILNRTGRSSEAPYGCFLPDLTRFGTCRRPAPFRMLNSSCPQYTRVGMTRAGLKPNAHSSAAQTGTRDADPKMPHASRKPRGAPAPGHRTRGTRDYSFTPSATVRTMPSRPLWTSECVTWAISSRGISDSSKIQRRITATSPALKYATQKSR